jgi:hypothetical protein
MIRIRVSAVSLLFLLALGTPVQAQGYSADEQSSLKRFRAELAVSVDGRNYSAEGLLDAKKSIQAFGVNSDDVEKIVRAMVMAGMPGSYMKRVGKCIAGVVVIFGMPPSDAAAIVTSAVSRGQDAVSVLDERINFPTASDDKRIRGLFDDGKAGEARKLVLDILEARLDAGMKIILDPS